MRANYQSIKEILVRAHTPEIFILDIFNKRQIASYSVTYTTRKLVVKKPFYN